jgi:hypothetical protein
VDCFCLPPRHMASYTETCVNGNCTPQRVAAIAEAKSKLEEMSKHACHYEGCNYRPSPGSENAPKALKDHIANMHTFVLKPCEHGCNLEKLLTKAAYANHLIRYHNTSTQWPARCSFPSCACTTIFKTIDALKYHLKAVHKLADSAKIEQYLPSP